MKRKAKVLIVESIVERLKAVEKALFEAEYETAGAAGTLEALKVIDEHCPDIIVINADALKNGPALKLCGSYSKGNGGNRYVPVLMALDREKYNTAALFDNPRWNILDLFRGKPGAVENITDEVEEIISGLLSDKCVILAGYYREEMKDKSKAEKTA